MKVGLCSVGYCLWYCDAFTICIPAIKYFLCWEERNWWMLRDRKRSNRSKQRRSTGASKAWDGCLRGCILKKDFDEIRMNVGAGFVLNRYSLCLRLTIPCPCHCRVSFSGAS